MKTVRLYINPNASGYVVEFEGDYYPFGPELSEVGEFKRIACEMVERGAEGYAHYLTHKLYRSHHERCVAMCGEPLAVIKFQDDQAADQ